MLRNYCGRPRLNLSHSSHTRPMEVPKPQKIVLVVLLLVLAGAWALVIWVATVVTQTMLNVLTYIVELAQMS